MDKHKPILTVEYDVKAIPRKQREDNIDEAWRKAQAEYDRWRHNMKRRVVRET